MKDIIAHTKYQKIIHDMLKNFIAQTKLLLLSTLLL